MAFEKKTPQEQVNTTKIFVYYCSLLPAEEVFGMMQFKLK